MNPRQNLRPTPRQIIVGDVHGHYETLLRLLEALELGADDRVDFLGDLIDRGPNSAQVVELVKSEPSFRSIRGNHEDMAIAALLDDEASDRYQQFWRSSGGRATLNSYPEDDAGTALLEEHLDWMTTLPLYRDLGDVWLVHAGVDPTLALSEQTVQQFCWIRDVFHSHALPYFADKTIVTGHTISFTFPGVQPGQVARGRGWLDIDTGAYTLESGWLTAIDMTHRRVYQANVWQGRTRSLAWEEAVVDVDPAKVRPRRFALN